MEIIITALSLLTILVVAILVATGGKPIRFFIAFAETLRHLKANGWHLA